MKYICYYEFNPKEMDEVIARFQKMLELRGKPEYPTAVSPTYGFGGQDKGFTLYEVDNQQQIINHHLHYHPVLKLKWLPLMEASDFVATYMKMKK